MHLGLQHLLTPTHINVFAKYDETIQLSVRLTLDPRKPNQNIKAPLTLPEGTGREQKVLVLASSIPPEVVSLGAIVPDSLQEAVEEIKKGDQSLLAGVDRVITSPKDMPVLAQIGRILGPRG
mgnify:CR=1 FL=1